MSVVPHVDVLSEPGGKAALARVWGPLNSETATLVQQRLEGLAAGPCVKLALDLGAADYLDSDGIRWLQMLHSDLTSRQIELRLVIPEGSRAERTLRLLQLDSVFTIDRPTSDSPEPRRLFSPA